jgi:hypothetical protein
MTDALYRAWIQKQPSCLDRAFSEYVHGEGRNLACHIRRAGRSGVAYKEEYACVPMSDGQHRYQHNHGELACLMKFSRDPQLLCTLKNASPFEAERISGEWFDAQVEKYREMWRKQTAGVVLA